MRKPNLTPSDVVNIALEVNSSLEKLKATIASWRQNGYNGTGEIPIILLPIEAQVLKTHSESVKMVEYILKLMYTPQPNRRDIE